MPEQLTQFLQRYISLNSNELSLINTLIPETKIKKGTTLLKQGQVSTAFYFIVSGCIRLYYETASGQKTAHFYLENSFVSSYESFTKQQASKHYLETLEDTVVCEISFEAAHQLLKSSEKFSILARIMMEEELASSQSIISSFITMNAEQRYLQLIKEKSPLTQRIPQYYLASFLGVSPETLSRIRKRITQ